MTNTDINDDFIERLTPLSACGYILRKRGFDLDTLTDADRLAMKDIATRHFSEGHTIRQSAELAIATALSL